MNKKTFPIRNFFPIQVPTELPQTVILTKVLQVGDRTNSFRQERLDLPYWIMIQVICALVDESICLDILTLEFWITLERPPFWLEYKLILHQLLVHHNQVVLQWYPLFLLRSFETQTNPVPWKAHRLQSRPFTMSSRSTTLPLYFWNFGSNSVFLRWHMSVNVGSGLSFGLFVLTEQPSFCSSLCPTVTLELFRASSIPCPLLLSHPEFTSRGTVDYTPSLQ